jgi:hypothetical protein
MQTPVDIDRLDLLEQGRAANHPGGAQLQRIVGDFLAVPEGVKATLKRILQLAGS